MSRSVVLAAFVAVVSFLLVVNVSGSSSENINVPYISNDSLVSVDAVLNFTSEWNESACVSWYSSLSTIEIDRVFITHSPNYLLVAGILFDPDSRSDDSVSVYLNYSAQTVKYVVAEDNSVVKYNLSGGVWVSSSTSAVASSSKSDYKPPSPTHRDPWWEFELRIPKSEFNSESSLKVFIIHEHTHKFMSYSRFPSTGNESDPSTWADLNLVSPLGFNVTLTFLDRDGNPIGYIVNETWVEIWNKTGNSLVYALTLNSTGSMSVLLQAENYTFKTFIYGNQVNETDLEVAADLTANFRLDNVKRVDTPLGFLVVTVHYQSHLVGIDLDCSLGRGIILVNGSVPARVWVDSETEFLHVAVLFAANFTYSPFTNHLLAYTVNGTTGFVFICGDSSFPIIYSANNTVSSYIFDDQYSEVMMDVEDGEYRFYSLATLFTIILNNSEISAWNTDLLNVTEFTVGRGNVRAYFENPVSMEVSAHGSSQLILVVDVGCPYVFPAKLTAVVREAKGKVVGSYVRWFNTSPPLTSVEMPLNVDLGKSYYVDVYLYDELTQRDVAYQTQYISPLVERVTVKVAPTLQEVLMENLWFILLIVGLALLALGISIYFE